MTLAALAGPAIHLANSLVDVGSDERVGRPSLATQLGPSRARKVLAILTATILVLAWATLVSVATPSGLAVTVALVATTATALGLTLSWQEAPRAREAGWLLQAVGLALMASAWLASMA